MIVFLDNFILDFRWNDDSTKFLFCSFNQNCMFSMLRSHGSLLFSMWLDACSHRMLSTEWYVFLDSFYFRLFFSFLSGNKFFFIYLNMRVVRAYSMTERVIWCDHIAKWKNTYVCEFRAFDAWRFWQQTYQYRRYSYDTKEKQIKS